MQRSLPITALLFVVTMVSLSSTARAGYPTFPGAQMGAWPNYYGWGASPYSLGQVPVPPYFALHPPVYYSMPVPRTYGYSPYAYPGTVQTPEILEVTPAVVENPYVAPSSMRATESTSQPAHEKIDTDQHSAAVRPVIIDNPFVGVAVATQETTPAQAD